MIRTKHAGASSTSQPPQIPDQVGFYQALMESASDAILAQDLGGVITAWNRGAEELYGYAADEAIGQHIAIIVPEERREEMEEILLRIGRGECIGEFDTRRVRKDGRPIDVAISVCPFNTATGVIVGAFAIARSVTGRKLGEEQFHLAVEASPSGMLQVDEEGTIQLVNAETERMFGYSREELIGQPVELLIPERFRAQHPVLRSAFTRQPIRRSMGAGRDLFGLRRNGSEFPVEIGLNPIPTSVGVRVLCVVIDITSRKEAERVLAKKREELARSNAELSRLNVELSRRQAEKMEAISRLASGVAHDFMNLLTVVTGGIDMLCSRLKLDQRSKDMLADMQIAADRATELGKQLMTFSKGSLLKREAIDLNQIVADSESVLRRLVGNTVKLALRLPTGNCKIEANPRQIDQVLLNLVVNARDATPPGGQVLMEVRRANLVQQLQLADGCVPAGEYILLVVSDTGKGMDDYTRSRIFEPFFTTKKTGQEAGMGLAAVYGIVAQNGGFIDVESDVGRGATFRVYFPAR